MNASEFDDRSSASRSDERDASAPTLRAPIVVEALGERWRANRALLVVVLAAPPLHALAAHLVTLPADDWAARLLTWDFAFQWWLPFALVWSCVALLAAHGRARVHAARGPQDHPWQHLASIALAVLIANLPDAWFHHAAIALRAWTTLPGTLELIVELDGRGPLGSSDRFIRSWGETPEGLAIVRYGNRVLECPHEETWHEPEPYEFHITTFHAWGEWYYVVVHDA